MKVYRLCNRDEVKDILNSESFENIGHKCKIDSSKNTHKYMPDINYMHFFESEFSLLYLYPSKGKMICMYDIPDGILNSSIGRGFYLNFVSMENLEEVTEYAVESQKIRFEYLQKIYAIEEDLDFEYFPEAEEMHNSLTSIYDFQALKSKRKKPLDDIEK